MDKKSSIVLLAVGVGALLTFASPLPAEANHYGRSRYETRREAEMLYRVPIAGAQALRKLPGCAVK